MDLSNVLVRYERKHTHPPDVRHSVSHLHLPSVFLQGPDYDWGVETGSQFLDPQIKFSVSQATLVRFSVPSSLRIHSAD